MKGLDQELRNQYIQCGLSAPAKYFMMCVAHAEFMDQRMPTGVV